jgi:hypothetical protein
MRKCLPSLFRATASSQSPPNSSIMRETNAYLLFVRRCLRACSRVRSPPPNVDHHRPRRGARSGILIHDAGRRSGRSASTTSRSIRPGRSHRQVEIRAVNPTNGLKENALLRLAANLRIARTVAEWSPGIDGIGVFCRSGHRRRRSTASAPAKFK